MHRQGLVAALMVAVTLWSATPPSPQAKSETSPPKSKSAQTNWTVSWRFQAVPSDGQTVELQANGRVLLRFRTPDALGQGQQLADQLNNALWQGATADTIAVVKVIGGYAILLQNKPLLTITHSIARQAKSEPKALAIQWASRLQEAFAWRWLAVPMQEAIIAVGEEVTLPLLGNAEGIVQVEALPPELVQAKVVTEGQKVQVAVRGVDVGAGVLRIVKGNVGVRLPFQVMYRAAAWKSSPVAWVRGKRVSAAMVQEAGENALLMALNVRVGAKEKFAPLSDTDPVAMFASNMTVRWRVQVTGEQLLPMDELVAVPLRSFPQSLGDAELLVISNDPETFREYRVLARGLLPPAQPVRFMVHHRNGLPKRTWLTLELLNTEDKWTWVTVRFGYGIPHESELRVGHEATENYLRAMVDDAAIRIALPPQSIYRLLRFALNPRDTASAIVEIRMDETAWVGYRVIALPSEPPKWESLSGTQLMEAMVSTADPSPYAKPQKFVDETHTAGSQWTFISIGRFGLQQPLKGHTLRGNYGVVYRVTVKFTNPTNRSWQAQLVLEPVGGVVRGAFVVDGRLIKIPFLRPHEEQILQEFPLAPNQTRTVTVVTVPAAGSFYPVHLIARTK